MSLTFKFDKKDETIPEQKEKNDIKKNIEYFDTNNNIRNLCLIETSGKKKLLNYSYLISVEFSPEESTITLFYTNGTVILKGHNLESLFDEFLLQSPKKIFCIDKRYVKTLNKSSTYVSEITVNDG